MNEFWNRVNKLLKEQKTTQEDFAEYLCISKHTLYSRISKGIVPNATEAVLIAHKLGVTVEYLVTGTESNKTAEELAELKTRLTKLSAQLAELSK